jgi:hypothetical protein
MPTDKIIETIYDNKLKFGILNPLPCKNCTITGYSTDLMQSYEHNNAGYENNGIPSQIKLDSL